MTERRAAVLTSAPLLTRDEENSPVAASRVTPGFLDTRPGAVLVSLTSLGAGLLLWQILAARVLLPSYMLPLPADVARTWWAVALNGSLWHHVSVTASEALLGFSLAFVVSALLAFPLARSRLVTRILSPYVAGTQAMPILALAPLLVVWFGFGLGPKALICAIIVFFPILVNMALGLRTVDRALIESAQTEGANPLQSLLYVEIPAAARTILGGVRMGLTLSLTGAIVAEFVASDSGLGYLMTLARSEYDSPLLFAAALTIVVLAVLAYLSIQILEALLIDWD